MTGALSKGSDRLNALRTDPNGLEAMMKLERQILGHRPRSNVEAATILDTVIPDMQAGGRSDGRDVSAVQRVRDFLLGR